MIDKTPYTPGMREVLKLSKAEAGRLGHDYIGPEHYLLAIIRKGDGLAVETLTNLGIDLEEVKDAIELIVKTGSGPMVGLFAPNEEAKHVLEGSRQVSNSMRHGWVGTEHLLLRLVQAEDTIPGKCLKQLGLNFEKAKREVINVIEGSNSDKATTDSNGAGASKPSLTLPYDIFPWLVKSEESLLDLWKAWGTGFSWERLDRAYEIHRRTGASLMGTICAVCGITARSMTKTIAERLNVPIITTLADREIDPEVLAMIPSEFARKRRVIPVEKIERTITVASADLLDLTVILALSIMTRCRIGFVLAFEDDLDEALKRFYGSDEKA